MMLENVKSYFESNVEKLEVELTKLSFDWSCVDLSELDKDNQVDELKNKYKEESINNIDDTSKDMLYYCNRYLDEWFTKSLDTIHLLYLKRTRIKGHL